MRAILYARYSPRPTDKDAIGAQVADMEAWCRAASGIDPWLVAYDKAVSGTVSMWNRPGLSQALGALRKGDVLVVRNLNRVARRPLVALLIEEEVVGRGARMASVEDGGLLDDSPQARLLRTIMYAVADYQRLEGNARTSRRMRQAQAEGRVMGSRPPYGKRIEDGQLVDDEDEQRMIPIIMAMAVDEGKGYGTIAEQLNQLGLAARLGTQWTPDKVRGVIRGQRQQQGGA